MDIYSAYVDQTNYHRYVTEIIMSHDIESYKLNHDDIEQLYDLVVKYLVNNNEDKIDELINLIKTDDILDYFSDDLINFLKHTLEKYNNKVFIRFTSASSKHSIKLTPITNIKEYIYRLLFGQSFWKEYYRYIKNKPIKDVYIFAMKWNDNIKLNNEFRVFVHNGKITGISQQHFDESIDYTKTYLEKTVNGIVSFFADFKNEIDSKNLYWLNNMLMDVWIDNHFKCHLIEMNASGIYTAGGSSLFHWINDYDILYDTKQTNNIYVRYNKYSALKNCFMLCCGR